MASTSFEDFHRERAPTTLRYARAIVRSDDAEDVCQEAWLRAWRSWGAADDDKLDAWMAAIVRNCCRDRACAKKTVHRSVVERDLLPEPAAEDAALGGLELVGLRALLGRLSAPQREVLWMREVLDLPYSEIADRQRVPIGTVMSRLSTARNQARRRFGARLALQPDVPAATASELSE